MADLGNVKNDNPNAENPFLLACNSMFKDFEKVSQEGAGGENENETFMKLL